MRFTIIFGLIMIILGLWLWLSRFGISFINFSRDWPVLLVILGAYIIYRRFRRKRKPVIKILDDIEKGKVSVEEAVERIKESRMRGRQG